MQHFLLTRFNVRFTGQSTGEGWSERMHQYMEARIPLFEQTCLPSIRAQTNRSFRWLMFFDPDTSGTHRRRLDAINKPPAYEPIYVRSMTELFSSINELVDPAAEYLVTTRIDNDDAFHCRAMEVISEAFDCQDYEYMNLLHGYIYGNGTVYTIEEPCNPFITLVEKRGEESFKTVFHSPHQLAHSHGPVRQIAGGPYWLRFIHGDNVANVLPDRGRCSQAIRRFAKRTLLALGLLDSRSPRLLRQTNLALKDLGNDFHVPPCPPGAAASSA